MKRSPSEARKKYDSPTILLQRDWTRVASLAEIARDAMPPYKDNFRTRAPLSVGIVVISALLCAAWVATCAFAWVDRDAGGRNDDFREVGFPLRANAA